MSVLKGPLLSDEALLEHPPTRCKVDGHFREAYTLLGNKLLEHNLKYLTAIQLSKIMWLNI